MVIPLPFQSPSTGAPPGGPLISPPGLPPAAPPSAGMGAGPDPRTIIERVVAPEFEPVYPSGYRVPPKPRREEILSRADSAKQAAGPWLENIADTFHRLRGHTAGYLTYSDLHKRGRPDAPSPFKSTQLIDQFNRFRAYGASLPIAYSIEEYDPDKFSSAQKVEDFSYLLRKMHERRWVERGNMPLAQSEWFDMLLYGTVVSRRTCNLLDEKCPIEATLQDPATIFPVIGRVGGYATLNAVYQIRTITVYELLADYTKDGDLPKRIKDAIGDKIGTFDESSEVDVVEYNDDWWRGVFLLGTDVDILPLTAHKYGRVPYVIQYGPGGESLHSRSPDDPVADYSMSVAGGAPREWERVFKARGFIDPMKQLHDYREGWGDRIQNRVLREFNPPLMLKQTMTANQIAGDPEINREEGGLTKLVGGEEDIGPLPEAPVASGAMSMLMQFIQADTQTNMLAPGFGQPIDKSNVSGTAQAVAAEQGRENESGWVQAMEEYHARCASHDVNLWRNFGHDARYQEDGSVKKFFVPRRMPTDGEERSFELTPDVIDSVDSDFRVTMNSLRMSELIVFGQAAQMFGPDGLGIWDVYTIAEKMGVTDVDRALANNRQYRSLRKAEELPEFAKAVTIPQGFKHALRAARGNPELQADILEQLVDWQKLIAQPQRQQLEASAQPQTPGPASPPTPGQGIAGGAGAPYAANPATAPGAQGAPVGRPSGPPVPPPDSVQVV